MKSDPEGANIYRADGHKLMGATPITLPVDLTGVSSVHLLIEKAGYERYDQIVVNDDPISISADPDRRAEAGRGCRRRRRARAGRRAAPAPAASKPHHHHASQVGAAKPDDGADAPARNEIE